ncbi:MAG: F0F1 ATP synthase subunit epsilon [Desulfohalobiaceae bacterium]
MSKMIRLEIVTPDKVVLTQDVEYVGVPGIQGQFGVLVNHIPFLSALAIGSLYYKLEGRTKFVFISGGFAEVSPDAVTILAETAEKAEEIDISRAQKAKERAEQRLRQAKDNIEFARAQQELMRAIHRMSAKERSAA